MKLFQTRKWKKLKEIKLFKNLNMTDFVIFVVSFVVWSLIANFTLKPLIPNDKTWLFVLIMLIPLPFIWFAVSTNRKYQVKRYMLLYRWIVFKTSKRHYKEKEVEMLSVYGNVEDNYIWDKSKKLVFGALEVRGKDIFKESSNDRIKFFESFRNLLNTITGRFYIVKLPTKIDLNKNLETLKAAQKDIKNKTLNNLFNSWETEIEDLDTSKLIDKYYLVICDNDKGQLNNKILNIKNELVSSKLDSREVSGKELVQIVNEVFIYDPNFNWDKDKPILDVSNVSFYKDYFKWKENYYSIQTILEFPLSLRREYIKRIFNSPSVIVWNLEKIEQEDLVNVLDKNMKRAELNIEEDRNKLLEARNKGEIDVLEDMMLSLVDGDETIFKSTILMLNKSNTRTSLRTLEEFNKENLRKFQAKIDPLVYRQFEALSSIMFGAKDLLNEYHEQIATNIAYGWPFEKEHFNDGNFLPLGKDQNLEPIFINPGLKNKTRTNHNMVIFGASGSGKSTFTRKLMSGYLANNDQVIVIDPQNEFSTFAKTLDGQVINLGTDAEIKINPLQIRKFFDPKKEELVFDNQSYLDLHENFFLSWLTLLYPHFDPDQINIIKSALHTLYQKFNLKDCKEDITELPDNKYPIMTDFINVIEEQNDSKEFHLSKTRLVRTLKQDFIDGRYKRQFNNHSSIEMNNKLIVFNISSLINQDEKTLNSTFYLLVSYLQGKISNQYNKKNKIWFFIDEIHKFINQEAKVIFKFIFSTVKEGRKYNCGVCLTTQQPQDFLKDESISKMGQAIVSGSQYSAIFSLKSSDIEYINGLFNEIGGLTDNEKKSIQLANIGQCLFIVSSSKKINLQVSYNDIEKELFWEKLQQINEE
ncbi:hypothetical protein VO56_02255 [Mycoplasmopsis gallinacea]|uniref:TraG P-loop domain-containing protein n=1 Tax=Mycoplasmopsis gallinacea TaxID=29556 RepID=A0A0D5ZJV6_9BACT|nr:hypothetical protein VO56_02255 [Mycoplasmopsis gallinacea]